MKKYYELQTDIMCYLNDNMVEDTEIINGIAEMFDLQFIDDEDRHGWYIIDDK